MGLIGCVDKLWDTCISGWASDDADHSRPVQVDVIVNSLPVATVPCATFRADLLAAGIGDGCKGFFFDPASHLKPGRNTLEVYYTNSGLRVPGGRGHWVRRRAGRITEWETAFLAALEAYHEFKPEHHVCGIGEGARDFARVLFEAEIPFRKFTGMDVPGDPAAILAEEVDLVVSWAWSTPAPAAVQVLKQLIQSHVHKPGFLAIGFHETAEVCGLIRQAFLQCGAPDVKLESIPGNPDNRRIFAFAKTTAAEPAPVWAHIHVPKCAGTSFRVLLETYFGPRHLGLYVNDTYFVYGDETIRGYLLQSPDVRGFSSHHVRSFPRWLAGREALYVTFLRDPVQQFVSYMTHIKKHYAEITSESLLAAVPRDASQLTLREFARWLLTQDCEIPFRENHNVNFFARHSAPAASDRLEAAIAALEGFFFVGITERMDESINKLRTLARAAGVEFPPGPIPVENTSADYRDDLGWIHPGDEVGSILLRSVEKDRQLYDWAAARLVG
jgi:hypothetical protein